MQRAQVCQSLIPELSPDVLMSCNTRSLVKLAGHEVKQGTPLTPLLVCHTAFAAFEQAFEYTQNMINDLEEKLGITCSAVL